MFVCCSMAQHGNIQLMVLTVTVGVHSNILKLPVLLKVSGGQAYRFYSRFFLHFYPKGLQSGLMELCLTNQMEFHNPVFKNCFILHRRRE